MTAAQLQQPGLVAVPRQPCACGAVAWHRPLDGEGRPAARFACMACHRDCGVCDGQAPPAAPRRWWVEANS